MELSIVIISRNQAFNICRLIESVIEASSSVASREIVLVDSASSDDTVALARQYPISVLRLSPGQHLCAAAGRHTGFEYTNGRYVLFLDGDMELCPGWLDQALRLLVDRPDIAVLTGWVIDVPPSEAAPKRHLSPSHTDGYVAAKEIPQGGGAAIYRRAVLEMVGDFNPYLYSEEEPELCLRIRHAGYRIMQLQRPMVFHYSEPSRLMRTVLARRSRRLYLGAGQNIRHHLGDELLWPYVRERGSYGLIPGVVLIAVLAVSSWSMWSGHRPVMWCMLLVGLLVFASYALWKRSLYQATLSILIRLVVLDGTIRGFLMKPRSPGDYVARFEVVLIAEK